MHAHHILLWAIAYVSAVLLLFFVMNEIDTPKPFVSTFVKHENELPELCDDGYSYYVSTEASILQCEEKCAAFNTFTPKDDDDPTPHDEYAGCAWYRWFPDTSVCWLSDYTTISVTYSAGTHWYSRHEITTECAGSGDETPKVDSGPGDAGKPV